MLGLSKSISFPKENREHRLEFTHSPQAIVASPHSCPTFSNSLLCSREFGSYFEEFLHQVVVWVHFLPRKATKLCVERVENVLRHFGGCAGLAVMHQKQPQCPVVAWQQFICIEKKRQVGKRGTIDHCSMKTSPFFTSRPEPPRLSRPASTHRISVWN